MQIYGKLKAQLEDTELDYVECGTNVRVTDAQFEELAELGLVGEKKPYSVITKNGKVVDGALRLHTQILTPNFTNVDRAVEVLGEEYALKCLSTGLNIDIQALGRKALTATDVESVGADDWRANVQETVFGFDPYTKAPRTSDPKTAAIRNLVKLGMSEEQATKIVNAI